MMNSTFDNFTSVLSKTYKSPSPISYRFQLKSSLSKSPRKQKTPKNLKEYTLDDFKFPAVLRIASPKTIRIKTKTPSRQSRGLTNGLCVQGKCVSTMRAASAHMALSSFELQDPNRSIKSRLLEKRSKNSGQIVLNTEQDEFKVWGEN
ncbi:unnamed protein product [Blepharisma stoltei]|uniref:Uncharacterized protein n=1 Tax=Blepharisma stoltei TaxID=1481888 RepID=A0AAU9J359_9CILI|nr:unnamed protein product [Blepharisma stoltei]